MWPRGGRGSLLQYWCWARWVVRVSTGSSPYYLLRPRAPMVPCDCVGHAQTALYKNHNHSTLSWDTLELVLPGLAGLLHHWCSSELMEEGWEGAAAALVCSQIALKLMCAHHQLLLLSLCQLLLWTAPPKTLWCAPYPSQLVAAGKHGLINEVLNLESNDLQMSKSSMSLKSYVHLRQVHFIEP